MSLAPAKNGELNPVVAVRSTGYSYDAIVGYHDDSGDNIALVDEHYLRTLVGIANERFQVNLERITRFKDALLEQYTTSQVAQSVKSGLPKWEDAEVRKRRKREEGLARQEALRAQDGREGSKIEP